MDQGEIRMIQRRGENRAERAKLNFLHSVVGARICIALLSTGTLLEKSQNSKLDLGRLNALQAGFQKLVGDGRAAASHFPNITLPEMAD